ncbi:MAG: hypothetical protein AAGD86_06875 [Pseudomonadota bacterium]
MLMKRLCCALLALVAAACSPAPEGEAPPSVIPVPQDLNAAQDLVRRIDVSLSQWQSGSTELIDYSDERGRGGGELTFWYSNETVRKIEATLPVEAATAHWQVYYTSTQAPFFAVYAEAVDGAEAPTAADTFVFLKDDAAHLGAARDPAVSLDEVRAFALQLVQSVHQR